MESTELKVVKAYTHQREEKHLVQFLYALRGASESLCGSILHCTHFSDIDSIFNNLFAKETNLNSTSTQFQIKELYLFLFFCCIYL